VATVVFAKSWLKLSPTAAVSLRRYDGFPRNRIQKAGKDGSIALLFWANNGAIGVWMIVIADDENSINGKRFKLAPPVDPKFGRAIPFGSEMDDSGSLRDFATANGVRTSHSSAGMSAQSYNLDGDSEHGSATRSAYTLRID
jgi:hypothetical protein